MPNIDAVKGHLEALDEQGLKEVLRYLRHEKGLSLHRLEQEFHTKAEVILESISRAQELTRRMLRGVIAEAVFKVEVVDQLAGWRDVTPDVNTAADFIIADDRDPVSIQVKLQRKQKGKPLVKAGTWIVETQKTRNGKTKDGDGTRLYRRGEFDILAVCMEPATGNWENFRYATERSLKGVGDRPVVLQTIPITLGAGWT